MSLKRGSYLKRSPLRRRSRLVARPKLGDRTNPARMAWKEPHAGFCECGCERFSLHLERHHVVSLETVKREGGDHWALSNSILLHPHCHANHTSAFRRIPLSKVPDAALDFGRRLLGEDRALLYFARFYAAEDPRREVGECAL